MMTDSSQLRKCLLRLGAVSEFQLTQAEDYALTSRLSLEQSLLFLEYVDFSGMGECLSQIHGVPYTSLLDADPGEEIRSLVPLDMARRYDIFPKKLDRSRNRLLLAVNDPADPVLDEEVSKLFPEELSLEFCVASQAEITQAIDIFYLGKEPPKACKIDVPEDFIIIPSSERGDTRQPPVKAERKDLTIVLLEPDRGRAGPIRSLLKNEGYKDVVWALSPAEAAKAVKREAADLLVVNGELFRVGGAWLREIKAEAGQVTIAYYEPGQMLLGQEHPYSLMSDLLIDMVAFWVRNSIKHNEDLLQEAVTRVKYSKLLGMRLGLRGAQLDGLVIAAWLSTSLSGKEAARKIPTPYQIEDIFNVKESEEGNPRIESQILRLVTTYQLLLKKKPDQARKTSSLRKVFSHCLSTSDQDTFVETFLRIIKEEEFLGRFEEGRSVNVLFVDPEINEDLPVVLRMANEGYETYFSRSVMEAMSKIDEHEIDVVISEIDLEKSGEGIELCRDLKDLSSESPLPVLIMTKEQNRKLHAQCLAAGADDFFLKPADLEVLMLRINRLLTTRESRSASRGVQGSLQDMSTVDFLQSLSAGEKNVEVVIQSGGEQGRIFMREGVVIHARTAELEGEEAFYAIVPWEEGEFQILPCTAFPEQTIHGQMESLLIEGFRRVDEAQNLGPEGELE